MVGNLLLIVVILLSFCLTLIGAPSNTTEPTFAPYFYSDPYSPAPSFNEYECGEEELECENGRCIPYYWQCDNYDDCGDNSDEKYCSGSGNGTESGSFACGDNFWRCISVGNCIPNSLLCNLDNDCADGSDEGAEAGCETGYQCLFDDGKLSAAELIAESQTFEENLGGLFTSTTNSSGGLSKTEVEDILSLAKNFQTTGVDVQDNLVLVSLLFMNVITVIFIILGLHFYDDKIGFNDSIDVSYITLLIIVTQHLLITSLNLFTRPVIKCTTDSDTETISWFDVMQYLISTTLWLIWLKYSYKGKCNKCCCAFFVILLTFLIPLIMAISSDVGFYISRYAGSGMVFSLSQLLMPTIWALIVINYPETMRWSCSKPLCSCCKCCQSNACCFMYPICGFIVHLGCVVGFIALIAIGNYQNSCLFIGGGMWFNPIWMFLNIILLFSSARYAVIMYNIIMLIITLMGSRYNTLCLYIINVQYGLHAMLLPVYIIVIFFSIAPISKWKFDLIQMYLVSFDVMTDVVVIYYFVSTNDYIFAVLSSSFIIIGQIFGSFSEMCGKDKMDHLTRGDKVLALFGFAGPWFIIKSWTDRKYALLEHKHQIWEIMFENMPGVALQIYAALTSGEDTNTGALTVSIFVSVVTISYSVWMYLVKFTYLSREMKNELENGQISAGLEDNNDPDIHPNGAAVELTVYGDAETEKQSQTENEGETKQTETDPPNGDTDDGTKEKVADAIALGVPQRENEAVPSGSEMNNSGDDENAKSIEEPQTKDPKDDNNNSDDIDAPANESNNDENDNEDNGQEKETETEKEDKSEERDRAVTTNVTVAVNDNDDDEAEYAKMKEDENVTKQKNDAGTIDKTLGEEEQAYEEAMEKLKQSRIVPAFIRRQFGDVLINRVLYSNLYFFMISDFYIRSMSIILFISLIPCGEGNNFCAARVGTGAVLFSGLLIFEFILNKRMRIVEYQGFGFVLTIFAISVLSSFYTILSSLHALRDDPFFGKSVDFKAYMFEHKVRIYLSVFMNVISVGLFFVNDPGNRNAFIFVLIVIFFFAVFINYFAVNSIQKYVDPPNQYPFKLCGNKCGGNQPTTATKKSPIVTEN